MTIVVLGGGIDYKGNLPSHVKERLKKAADIYREHPQAKILLCGKYSFLHPKNKVPPKTEARAMKEYLLKLSIPSDIIFLEQKSKDTISNAYYAKKLYFLPRKEKEAYIITSEFHIPRTKYIFQKVFGDKYKFRYVPVSSDLRGRARRRVKERQRELLGRTRKILSPMKEGNHDFLRGKFYKIKYYREKRPNWVVKFITQGK
jgi:uncharacterized SAM-binding protein YcdF (DUF218 family)